MFRIHQRLVVSLACLALCGAGPPEQKTEQRAAQEQQWPAEAYTPVEAQHAPYADKAAEKCEGAQHNNGADLCTQWRAAVAGEKAAEAAQRSNAIASTMFWLALISIVVTTAGTIGLFWQIVLTRRAVAENGEATLAMKDQNVIAREAQRPWLSATIEIVGDITWSEEDGMAMPILITLYNKGRSPAFAVKYGVRFFPHTGEERPLANLKQLQVHLESLHLETDGPPVAIFPGETHTEKRNVRYAYFMGVKGPFPLNPTIGNYSPGYVAIGIHYSGVEGSKRFTGYSWAVLQDGRALALMAGRIPRNTLCLVQDDLSGAVAT